MTYFEAILLAIVEGLTEFLPISSTGHLILANSFLGINPESHFAKLYIINIQFGAILSVLFLYWKRFFQAINFYYKLFVAFIPAAVFGFLLNDYIDSLLESVTTVAVSLVLGGIVLVFTDEIFAKTLAQKRDDTDFEKVNTVDEFGIEHKQKQLKEFPIDYKQSFIIGFFQVLAMIPGVSRSAATIIGGLQQKLSMKRAAEFSFFLGVPTIAAAAGYKLLKEFRFIKGSDIDLLLIGNLVSFIVGIFAIRFFIGLITRYGLKFFGWYRIIIGSVILILLLMGKTIHL